MKFKTLLCITSRINKTCTIRKNLKRTRDAQAFIGALHILISANGAFLGTYRSIRYVTTVSTYKNHKGHLIHPNLKHSSTITSSISLLNIYFFFYPFFIQKGSWFKLTSYSFKLWKGKKGFKMSSHIDIVWWSSFWYCFNKRAVWITNVNKI